MPTLPLSNCNYGLEQNICFVNSTIQLLCSIPMVREYFQYQIYSTDPYRTYNISSEINQLFTRTGIASSARLRMLIGRKRGLQRFMDGSQQDAVDFLHILINELEKEIGCFSSHGQKNHKVNCFVSFIQGIEVFKHRFVKSKNGACSYCGTFPSNSQNSFEVFHLSTSNSKPSSIQNLLVENLQKPSEKFTFICSGCKHGKPQEIQSFRSIIKGRFTNCA